MRIQLRFPLRCFAFGLRPSFNVEDLLPPLFVPLPPFLFFRPLRSLRVRSFCKENEKTPIIESIKHTHEMFFVHIYGFLGRECRKLLRHLVEFWPMFEQMALITKKQNLWHMTGRSFEWVNQFYFLPLNEKKNNKYIFFPLHSIVNDTYKP